MPGGRFEWRRRFGLAAASLVALVLGGAPARGDLQVDGRWRQSALREDFTVQQWLNGCGPTPQSNSTGGGEIVAIRMEGDELAFVGGGRVYRTNSCYDPMPTLTRESHSRDASGKSWRTRCSTPANDPRKALLNTLVVATSDTHIDIVETGRYEIVLETGRCMADIKRTRSFDLVADEAPKATAPAKPPPAPAAKAEPRPSVCDTLGEPSRLEVRPSKKLLRTGETFQFHGLVLDDKGCTTRTAATFKLAPGAEGKGVTVDAAGKVTVAREAPEGTLELVASAVGKETRVTVEVSEPSHYDDLLARSGLNASGENDAASVVSVGSQAVGAGQSRVEDRAHARRLTFIAIVGSVLLVLGLVGAVLLRRSRRALALEREAEERHEARVREVLERRRERAGHHAAQQRAHEESVAAARAAAAAPAFAATEVMPGAAVPPGMAGAPTPAKRGKICPRCGDRSDGTAEFCGKDGTQLVLLN